MFFRVCSSYEACKMTRSSVLNSHGGQGGNGTGERSV